MSTVVLRNISKSYQGVPALNPLYLTVREGEFLSILGPSGCGKTTLLRSLAGLVTPDTGTITIGERRVFDAETRTQQPSYRRKLGMVFQDLALWPHLTIFENVAFPLRVSGTARQEIRDRVLRALTRVQMQDSAQKMPHQLSGGQQQRVAIARAVVAEPEVLLMDEPFSALDAALRNQLRLELVELTTELGLTTIYVTHDQEEAMAMSDRIMVMKAGSMMQLGSPEDLYREPANGFVAGFIGTLNRLPDPEGAAGVRPEAVRLDVPADSAERLSFPAEVASCIYAGGRYMLRCRVAGAPQPWLVEAPQRHLAGDSLTLHVRRSDLLHLPASP